MKQAYTNATRKHPKAPLSLKAHKGFKKGEMPMCRYGAACAYKSTCMYRHPKKGEVAKSDQVCIPFVGGFCQFGEKCFNAHPGDGEVAKLKAKYATTPCRFGATCRTEGCLYMHVAPQHNSNAGDTVVEAERKRYESYYRQEAASAALSASAAEWTPGQPFVPKSQTAQAATTIDWNNPNVKQPPTPQQYQVAQKAASRPTPLKVKIPLDLWLNDYERSAGAFGIQDPVERFSVVNAAYGRAERQAVLGRLGASVMDMHYQSQVTAEIVLNRLLMEKLSSAPHGCWVITGTGHHTADGHQIKGGVLFDTVKDYLEYYGYSYNIGIDRQSRAGAFFVKKAT